MSYQLKMESGKSGGPVECLGMTFPSEDARRYHFLSLLAEKLKDPAFRAQEGFPKATDEAILAMSDPPYYTACPNPFLNDYVAYVSNKSSTEDTPHAVEPFVADVSEGKYDPIYHFHPYHTKVPHKAILRYLLHYTRPGDIVLDAFSGTGMTGVACIKAQDDVAVKEIELTTGRQPPEKRKLESGVRHCILSDLSPIASFIAYNYSTPSSALMSLNKIGGLLQSLFDEMSWQYQTLHAPTEEQVERVVAAITSEEKPDFSNFGTMGYVNSTVWSDVFSCPECAEEIVFWNTAVDIEGGTVLDSFNCPSCAKELTKRQLERRWENFYDPSLDRNIRQLKQVPVLINYTVNGRRAPPKQPDAADLALIAATERLKIASWHPTREFPEGDKTQEAIRNGFTHVHQFYTRRNLATLSRFNELCDHPILKGILTRVAFRITKRYALTYQSGTWGAGGGPTNGTLYVPSLVKELNMIEMLRAAAEKESSRIPSAGHRPFVSTQSSTKIELPNESVDYIFADPPFGANFAYSELNFIWESWLDIIGDTKKEAVENRTQGKRADEYRRLMADCFSEMFRVLKSGRWATIEFSNTKASVWNSIQSALQESGFVIANVSALDKKKGSFNAQTNPTSVKQDLIITAYKPRSEVETEMLSGIPGPESLWNFVRSHLEYLPVVKEANGQLEFIVERDPRILYDRVVAWYVRHNCPVPVSSQEFRDGLHQYFAERDGMFFNLGEVSQYERSRKNVALAPQRELFVSDEKSAIDWIFDFLKSRPSTYQELQPEFFSQLGAGWRKHEARPELSSLLDANFLVYQGNGDVPSQIHAYLSTNFKELRGLTNDDPRLKAKAKDRWYVPDLRKAKDLEQKREKALLKEFEDYRNTPSRKLKEFRLEVLRAGFKAAWASKDYQTIVSIANKVPEDALQEDEKLLFWYDSALTRTGG
jgi:DNA modification methylase